MSERDRTTDPKLELPAQERSGLPGGSHWSVEPEALRKAGKSQLVLAVCVCGTRRMHRKSKLVEGQTLSCGCIRDRDNAERRKKHGGIVGHRPSHEYSTWTRMIQRTENPENPDFADYGARGIRVCVRWRKDAGAFLTDMGERPPGTSIDRKDNERGYSCGKCEDCLARGEPANCRWATGAEQARNKRNNVIISYNGESLTVAEWSKRVGIKAGTLRARVKVGWDAHSTLTLAPHAGRKK